MVVVGEGENGKFTFLRGPESGNERIESTTIGKSTLNYCRYTITTDLLIEVIVGTGTQGVSVRVDDGL